MSTLAAHTATTASAYTPGTSRDALIAECIGHILAGTPYREELRPRVAPVPRPGSAREGIESILGAPRH
jgi:hypothetical protein